MDVYVRGWIWWTFIKNKTMKEYNYIWTTAEGKKIHIDDMTESHAKNCLKLLLRKIEDHNDSIKSKETTREKMIREMKDPNHNPFLLSFFL